MVDISKYSIGKKRAWVGEQQAEDIEDSEYDTFKLGGVFDGDVSIGNVVYKQAKLIDSSQLPTWIGLAKPKDLTQEAYDAAFDAVNFDYSNNGLNTHLTDLSYANGWRLEKVAFPRIATNKTDISTIKTQQSSNTSDIIKLKKLNTLNRTTIYKPVDFYWYWNSSSQMYISVPRYYRWTFSGLPIDYIQLSTKHTNDTNPSLDVKTSSGIGSNRVVVSIEFIWTNDMIVAGQGDSKTNGRHTYAGTLGSSTKLTADHLMDQTIIPHSWPNKFGHMGSWDLKGVNQRNAKIRICYHKVNTNLDPLQTDYGMFTAEINNCTDLWAQGGSHNPWLTRLIHVTYASPGIIETSTERYIVQPTTMTI